MEERQMSLKVVASTIAFAVTISLSYPTFAMAAGVGGAAGGAVNGVTGAVQGGAEGVTGHAGDATANQGGLNPTDQVAGQKGGKQGAGQANFGNIIAALNNVSAEIQNV